MDQDSAHIVVASKVPMLKPSIVEGVEKVIPITSAEDKAQRRLEVKARSTLTMGIPNEHELKFNSIKDAKLLLEAVEKRFGGNATTKKTQRNLLKQQYENFTAPSPEMLHQTFDRLQNLMSQLDLLDEKHSQEDVNKKLLRSLSPEWNTHAVVWRNKAELETMSIDDLYKNLKVSNEAVNAAHGVTTASNQVNTTYSTNIDNLKEMDLRWQMAMLTMRARRFLKNTGRKLTVNGNETIGFDKSKVECYNCHKRGHFARECRAPRNQDNKNKESSRRSSDQAEEGPNYALMAYSSSSSDSEVSNDSNCSKSCMETVKLLKSQNDQLLRDLEKSSLMVLGYKTGLESVEEKLEFYKKNKSVYVEKINGLKWDIQVGEITIRELKKKLEKIQKEKDSIQFNVDKFENASKSLNKLIECQIVDNCKKGLGYEKYNAVPPPYTGNFMPPTPDLSFTGLDEFVNKPVVENRKSDEEVSKVVRKSDDSLIIEDWVSDSEEENVSQTKTEKKIVKPSIAKIEFVKPKQQEKTARKTSNPQMDLQDKGVIDSGCSRHMTGNMSYLTDYEEIDGGYVTFRGNPKGGKITEKAVNTACYVQNRVLVVKPHNKTPYELFHGRTPTLSFMKPFGCSVTILNTIDHLGKFDGKADEGFFVGYSLNSKAFRVFKSRTRIGEENFHTRFSESTPNIVGSGPNCLFDIDALTRTMNYEPIVAETQSNGFAGTKASDNVGQARKQTEPIKNYILLQLWTADPPFSQDPRSSHIYGIQTFK
ncbi:retrovirus-related pol polyprotein from transposon TNT 1-94 [Tanacetum coccineum]